MGLQLGKKFPAFHGTRRFITALTSVRHLSLSWASPVQSIYPHPTSWRSILILSTNLRLGLPSGLFPSGFPTKNLYTRLSSPIRATCSAHLSEIQYQNFHSLSGVTKYLRATKLSRYNDWVRAGRSGIESRWGARFSFRQGRLWGAPSVLYNGYWGFPRGRGS